MSRRIARGRPRRVAAGVLALAGAAGLSLASASWLDMPWASGEILQGGVRTAAGCQDGAQIVVTYGAPEIVRSGPDPWGVRTVSFTGVAPACVGRSYEVAYSTDGSASWTVLGGSGVVPGPSVAVDLAGVEDPAAITSWAMTIY